MTFDAELLSWVEATIELGHKRISDGAVLKDRKIPEVPIVFVDGESTSPSEARLSLRQFLGARYSADFEESLGLAAEEVASIYEAAGDLQYGADLADLTGGAALGSRASICGNCRRPREACSVVIISVFSSVRTYCLWRYVGRRRLAGHPSWKCA